MTIRTAKSLIAVTSALLALSAGAATTYNDDFMAGRARLQWKALGDACLTAGDGSGSVPACSTMKIKLTDGRTISMPMGADEKIAGQGALLLTPGQNQRTGAILSNFPPFPLTQGIQVTFNTFTYAGDAGGTGAYTASADNGADGIAFFLTDGTQPVLSATGGSGGSLGYSCSNQDQNFNDGVASAYLGLGIDEYGNFLNSQDNTDSGVLNSNVSGGTTAYGSNGFYNGISASDAKNKDPQFQPWRIGLRGAGNVNWAFLNGLTPDYYKSNSSTAQKRAFVKTACSTGQVVWKVEKKCSGILGCVLGGVGDIVGGVLGGTLGKVTGYTDWTKKYAYVEVPYNYNVIPGGYKVLPGSRDCKNWQGYGSGKYCAQWGDYSSTSQPIANISKNATRNPTANTAQSNIAWPITYKLTISPKGFLNFAYSYNNGAFQPVLVNKNIIDDNGPLPASLRFGFSAGTGDHNNIHEITCFSASPLQSNSSAASNTVTGRVTGNTQFFLASFSPDNWWGSLLAAPLVIQADGSLGVGSSANWDAACVLTGGLCDSMGLDANGAAKHTITVQAPAARKLFTWNAAGVDLQWAKLSSAQQTALNTGPTGTADGKGSQRVQWLQGVRSVEQLQDPPGTLRSRTFVLGDIVDSSPTFVGPPAMTGLPAAISDKLYPAEAAAEAATTATKYNTYAASKATRQHAVYVGANDGYVHAFRAGYYKTDGSFDTATNDGRELFAFMPAGVLGAKAVNLSNPLYAHDYMVDATPAAADLFYNNTWHTWLVGGVGSSGKEIFALDVTDPVNFSAANVVGDWDSSNASLGNLGNSVGTPIITRMHNGQWAIVFGNGLGSGKSAGVYIGLVDKSSGAVSFQFLDTGVGSATLANGIAYVAQVDLDGDDVTDYLYAGDSQGNVWRFDVTSKTASDWAVTQSGGKATPLFVAKNASGTPQPIATSITLLAVQTGTQTRAMVYFGSGQQIPQTGNSATQYAPGAHTFYGIWDWDMAVWNGKSSSKYASLTGPQTVNRGGLLAQAPQTPPDAGDVDHRYLSTTAVVCWKGDAASDACENPSQYGWMFDLPDAGPTSGPNLGQGEQVVYNPVFLEGAIVVNTAIPAFISAAQCNPGLQRGWTMAFNPATGGGFPKGYFADAGGGFGGGDATVGGTRVSGVGSPTSLQYGGKTYLVTQTITGGAVLIPVNPPVSDNPARVSWRELVNP